MEAMLVYDTHYCVVFHYDEQYRTTLRHTTLG